MKIEVKKLGKDKYDVVVDGVTVLSSVEKSNVRYLIQELDNTISI